VALGDGTHVTLLQHTGTGLALARTLPGSGTLLTLADVDGDGRRDVAWVDGESVQVARNGGDFTFAPQTLMGGTGTPLSLSVGDADGDGDVDVAASYSHASGPRASRTGLFLNQAR
jgi:hypothetical protein